MTSFDELQAKFKPVTVEVRVCLDGELAAEVDRLEQQLAQVAAEDERVNRLPEAPGIADRIVELTDRMQAAEQVFVFQSIGRLAWAALLDKHPPSDEDREDGHDFGEGFPVAAVAASCASPSLTEDQAGWLAEHLSLGQFIRLQSAAVRANVGDGGAGKAPSSTALRFATEPRSTTAPPEESRSLSSVDE